MTLLYTHFIYSILNIFTGPNIEINYDTATKSAKEAVMDFTPWAKCHGCYFWAGVKVVIEMDVTDTGLNKFLAFIEGG